MPLVAICIYKAAHQPLMQATTLPTPPPRIWTATTELTTPPSIWALTSIREPYTPITLMRMAMVLVQQRLPGKLFSAPQHLPVIRLIIPTAMMPIVLLTQILYG